MAVAKSKKRRQDRRRTSQPKAAPSPSKSVLVSLQRCSAVPWRPSPVVAVAVCPDQTLVAVARGNGSISLWCTAAWTCVLVIPGKGEAAYTSLCWAQDHVTLQWRLFSCGLDGYVVEWDFDRRQPCATSSSMGGAAWHMAAQPIANPKSFDTDVPEDALIALATDDGAVRILAAEPVTPGLQYRSTAGRADARALCVAWRHDGRVVYAGFSDGCIRAMDIQSGTETLRITAGTNPGGEPACIWALACIPDGSLASGSSRGTVQFWETQFGTSLSTVQQHQADVNALAVSPSGAAVFAAGVDPSVVLIKREAATAPGGPARYAYSDRRRPHTHDVRAMAVLRPPLPHRSASGGAAHAQPRLLTAGNDAELLVHSMDRFTAQPPVRVAAAPCAPAIAFACNGRFAVADVASLDIWQAPQAEVHGKGQSVREEGEALHAATPPQRLACIELDDAERPLCAAISPCGNFVACASPDRTDMFAIIHRGGDDEKSVDTAGAWNVVRLRVPGGLPAASALTFAEAAPVQQAAEPGRPRSSTLLLAALDGRLLALPVDVDAPGAFEAATDIPLPSEVRRAEEAQLAAEHTAYAQALPAITHLTASPCGRLVALASPRSIVLLRRQSGQSAAFGTAHALALPHSPSVRPVSSMAFSPCSRTLALSTVDDRLELYSCASRTRLEWLHRLPGLSAKLDLLAGHVEFLAFRPGAEPAAGASAVAGDAQLGSLMLCSRSRMCHVDLDALKAGVPVEGARASKTRRRRVSNGFSGEAPGLAARVMALPSVLLGAGWVGGDGFLTVQADREAAMQHLPAPLLLKLYGQ